MSVPHLKSLSFALDLPNPKKASRNVTWPRQLCASTICRCLWGFCSERNCSALQWMTGSPIFHWTGIIHLCILFFFCRIESEQVNKTKLTGSFSWPNQICLDPCLNSFCSIQKSGLGKWPGHLSWAPNIILSFVSGSAQILPYKVLFRLFLLLAAPDNMGNLVGSGFWKSIPLFIYFCHNDVAFC